MVTAETMSWRYTPQEMSESSGRRHHKSRRSRVQDHSTDSSQSSRSHIQREEPHAAHTKEVINTQNLCNTLGTRLAEVTAQLEAALKAKEVVQNENSALHLQLEEVKKARVQEKDSAKQAALHQSRAEADKAILQAETQRLGRELEGANSKLQGHEVDVKVAAAVQKWSEENRQLKDKIAILESEKVGLKRQLDLEQDKDGSHLRQIEKLLFEAQAECNNLKSLQTVQMATGKIVDSFPIRASHSPPRPFFNAPRTMLGDFPIGDVSGIKYGGPLSSFH